MAIGWTGTTQSFVIVGLDHRHAYDLTQGLLDAGLECAGYWTGTSDPRVLQGFRARFPDLLAVEDRAALLEDAAASILLCAAIPCDRAGIAMAAMQAGMDVLMDKPGVTTAADLAALERCVTATGRIFSVCFSERFLSPSTAVALRLIRAGEIGRVVHTAGFGPHRLNRAIRPAWFFDPAAYGGILCDIGSHQIEQFLAFTGSDDAMVAASTVGTFDDPRAPGLENFGEIVLRSAAASGYCRVDWFTPDGLPSWGDGRLTVVGTEGTIELRKNLDIEGRPGADHLFLSNRAGTSYVDCSREPLRYFADFARDCRERTATAMAQSHVFTVCRLALAAQAGAARITLPGGIPR